MLRGMDMNAGGWGRGVRNGISPRILVIPLTRMLGGNRHKCWGKWIRMLGGNAGEMDKNAGGKCREMDKNAGGKCRGNGQEC